MNAVMERKPVRKAPRKTAPSVDARLTAMLSVKRPHESKAEMEWCQKYLGPYSPLILKSMFGVMAYVIEVGTGSKTLFSAHVDTVHRTEGPQKLCYDPVLGDLFKDDGEPLGADDGAGVWLLLEMIDAGVPGSYVITRGEEKGGIGARFVANNHPEFLERFDRAIAFDRKGQDSVISEQGHGVCCSDAFAEALSEALNAADHTFMYSPDDTGVYTDTAEYIDFIPECTNVSVGYMMEHTQAETLNVPFLVKLRNACVSLDWEALPTKRDPKAPKPKSMSTSWFDTGYNCNEFMTRDEMLEAAACDPEQFVNDLREFYYGESAPDDRTLTVRRN